MSPTKMALIENIEKKMKDSLKEIEEIEKNSIEEDENLGLILKDAVQCFSESINNFRAAGINERLFLLTQRSIKSSAFFITLLKKSLKKELTAEINDLMKKSGLLCGILVD